MAETSARGDRRPMFAPAVLPPEIVAEDARRVARGERPMTDRQRYLYAADLRRGLFRLQWQRRGLAIVEALRRAMDRRRSHRVLDQLRADARSDDRVDVAGDSSPRALTVALVAASGAPSPA